MRVIAVALVVAVVASAVLADHAPVDEWIKERVFSGEKVSFFVKMKGEASLQGAAQLPTKAEKGQHVYDSLTYVAKMSQQGIIAYLESIGAEFKSHWIINCVEVHNGDAELIQTLSERSDVDSLFGNVEYDLHVPVAMGPSEDRTVDRNEWNIDIIDAPLAWGAGFSGDGITVSNIDTGARWTHEALRPTYRGDTGVHDYNWWDPRGTSAAPSDNNGHGSHTIGSVAGSLGIGVAPGARWIAARGCASSSCSTADLMSSFEFIICPTRVDGTNPDCSQAPHVVNNSWGGGQGSQTYQSLIQACRAAGIVVVFSQGNSGPSCGSANSPGDNPGVIGVGATTSTDALASFSSRGPGRINSWEQKPEISAPGANVRSSTGSSDSSYASYSGTSMASPHITGVVALMLNANPSLSVEQVENLIISAVNTTLSAPMGGQETCDGVHYTTYPNYHYGYGRVNAWLAVQLALAEGKRD